MHRPGTTAVLGSLAGFEARAAQGAAITVTDPAALPGGVPSLPGPADGSRPAPVTTLGLPSSQRLPCTDDPDLFFAESPDDVEYAKALCRTCPRQADCLSGALERAEPWGVWGGELFLRGVVVPRKRPRGPPRKPAVAACSRPRAGSAPPPDAGTPARFPRKPSPPPPPGGGLASTWPGGRTPPGHSPDNEVGSLLCITTNRSPWSDSAHYRTTPSNRAGPVRSAL